jgi:two-component system chemotaxis response regulator CheY
MTGTAPNNSTVARRDDTGCPSDKRSTHPYVLIVDDDPELREFMAQVLSAEGFDTDLAHNGQDALDKAHEDPPRLIVLDMMMPVMDGWTFRAHQRYCATLAAIPVVVLTGVPFARVRNIGAAATLRKPVDTDELITAVRALC